MGARLSRGPCTPMRPSCPLAGPAARGTILRALGAAVNRCFVLRVIC